MTQCLHHVRYGICVLACSSISTFVGIFGDRLPTDALPSVLASSGPPSPERTPGSPTPSVAPSSSVWSISSSHHRLYLSSSCLLDSPTLCRLSSFAFSLSISPSPSIAVSSSMAVPPLWLKPSSSPFNCSSCLAFFAKLSTLPAPFPSGLTGTCAPSPLLQLESLRGLAPAAKNPPLRCCGATPISSGRTSRPSPSSTIELLRPCPQRNCPHRRRLLCCRSWSSC